MTSQPGIQKPARAIGRGPVESVQPLARRADAVALRWESGTRMSSRYVNKLWDKEKPRRGRKLKEGRTKTMVGMLYTFIACSPHKIRGMPASCRILLTVWMSGWITGTEEHYVT